MADEAIRRLPGAVSSLWGAIAERFRGKPAAEAAAHDLTSNAEDEDNREAFELQLRKVLKESPAFVEEISVLLEKARPSVNISNTGPGTVAMDRSIAAGAGGAAMHTVEKSNVALAGEKSPIQQVNIHIYEDREPRESKSLASPDSAGGDRITKDSSAGGLAKEMTDQAIMSVNRRRLEDLRDLQHELNAYVQGYLEASKELPGHIRSAATELQNCRGKLRANLALGDNDWLDIKKALAMVSTFGLDRQGPNFDRDFSMAQKEFENELKGARQEVTKATQTTQDLQITMNRLGNAVDSLIQAEAKLEPISTVCQQGATNKLQEIESLLKEIFRPYELLDEARRSTEGRLGEKHSKISRRDTDLRQSPSETTRPA